MGEAGGPGRHRIPAEALHRAVLSSKLNVNIKYYLLLVKFHLLTKHVFTRQKGKGLEKACLVHTGTSRGVYTERRSDDVDSSRTAPGTNLPLPSTQSATHRAA